ncbi:MAG TPA: glycosyltransferase N-terminal domain-containing protein [Cyclobacteriaceae bacterium]|nr:glycosyltransferase N-terminal domain-containing protein [Cyclobacteriaceae bacterium]
MIILYNLLIGAFGVFLKVAALFNEKAKAFTDGRKNLFNNVSQSVRQHKAPLIWMHCASLGEFEQGRPILEKLKAEFPQYRVLLTFFSPSGYEVQRNYEKADFVFYLPLDTSSNAWRFISITKPTLAIFVKYEFWYHFCHELRNQGIPLISISSIFREDQLFFRSYGEFYRSILFTFSHLFVQNNESLSLLKSIGVTHCSRVGDTRFDRVYQIVMQGEDIPLAEKFKGSEDVFVVGSCWPDDMDVLIPFINVNGSKLKFIIAPHEISEEFITEMEGAIQVKNIRFSRADGIPLEDYRVLIIDNIGMLSRLYRYGNFAFVGGGYSKGLHNILEAACYGVPIFFGNRQYQKYEEATQLIKRGGAFEINDYPDLKAKFELLTVPQNFQLACEVTKQYVQENLGASERIMKYCRAML